MRQAITIDLNADLGEFANESSLARDAELMRYVTTANVACGGHAGDETTIRRTITAAKAVGVAVGAHPSYPDRENFGRVEMRIALDQLEQSIAEQIRLLVEIAREEGVRASHVKPHGALYHSANKSREVARAIARAVISVGRDLVVIGQSGSSALEEYRSAGLRTVAEAFVDRSYNADGKLRDRKLPGALLDSAEAAKEQAIRIALRQPFSAFDGTLLRIEADTICLHSDTPDSVTVARLVQRGLVDAGVQIGRFA